MTKPLLFFEQDIDLENFTFFREGNSNQQVSTKLVNENGDPTHVVMASIDFASLGEIAKSAELLLELTRRINDEGKKPTRGIASIGEEVLSHLITWHTFAIIQIAQKEEVDQKDITTSGVLASTSKIGNLSRTGELMQAGFEEYLQFVRGINAQFVKPITWASLYAFNYLDRDQLGLKKV